MAKSKKTDDSITFLLTPEERDLLLEFRRGFNPAIATRLRFGVRDGECLLFQFPRSYVEEVLEVLIFAGEQMRDPELQRQFADLSMRLVCLLKGMIPRRPDAEPGSNLPPGMLASMENVVKEMQGAPPEEIDAALAELMAAENRRPREEFCGLSSEQMYDLVYTNWREPNSPLQTAKDIPLAELENSDYLVNARLLLEAAAAPGGIKATVAGNLNRKTVEHVLEKGRWPAPFLLVLRQMCKVVNETDVMPLETLRLLLTLAGLMRKSKGAFRITRAGEKLRGEHAAGALFAVLFETYFRRYNLAYMDYHDEHPDIQPMIAYSIYVVAQCAEEWALLEELTDKIFPPIVKEAIAASLDRDDSQIIAKIRILEPLLRLGLIEIRLVDKGSPYLEKYDAVRKTPLFDRLIQFRFSRR